MRRAKAGLRRVRRGANAVEFALVLPVLVVLLMGTVEFGWYFHHQAIVLDCLRQGLRAASMVPSDQSAAAGDAAFAAALVGYGRPADSASLAWEQDSTAGGNVVYRATATMPYSAITGGIVPGTPAQVVVSQSTVSEPVN